jgi:AcrR family transcriptional regulator
MSERRKPHRPPTGRGAKRGGAALSARHESVKSEASSSTRERILKSAERLFAENGFDRVTMPMIAAASGITAGAIYKHFDSKSDLFFEVVRGVVLSTPIPTVGSGPDQTLLPRIVAAYTTKSAKLLRQLVVEIHYASAKHSKVRRLLRRALDHNVEQIRDGVASMQRAGMLDQASDPQSVARAVIVFVMGLMHMETLLPQLVGDAEWHDFVQERVAALIGALDLETSVQSAKDGESNRSRTTRLK